MTVCNVVSLLLTNSLGSGFMSYECEDNERRMHLKFCVIRKEEGKKDGRNKRQRGKEIRREEKEDGREEGRKERK